MKKKIGVILSGCGVRDGSEVHEAVLTLLAIDLNGGEAVCMAPDIECDEFDHLTMKKTGKQRNILVESARIARGNILDIKDVSASELDALIFPGGSGAAKNLCNFAEKGAAASVHLDVARLLRDAAAAGKPIGAICIAPVIVAAALGRELSPTITIGNDQSIANAIIETASIHVDCPVTEIVVDHKNKIVTTPAYMLAESISEAYEGINKTVKAVMELAL